MEEFVENLESFCETHFGANEVANLERLSGGASMETWLFLCGGTQMILRRLPLKQKASLENVKSAGVIKLSVQADVLDVCIKHDILVPRVLARLSLKDNLGIGFIMEKCEGEALPQKIYKSSNFESHQNSLSKQIARTLAEIHSIPIAASPVGLTKVTPTSLLEGQRENYERMGAQIPAFELAFGWLSKNRSFRPKSSIVHGDFRMGNLLVNDGRLSAVLDWELTHIGDPVRDLAYFCTPSWRFGRYEQEAGGIATKQQWISAYEAASGYKVELDQFNWWSIFNTLWWGISCLFMGNAYREGNINTVERTIIGRRISEVEVDLLLQFEALLPVSKEKLEWSAPEFNVKTGEMSYSEVLGSLKTWHKTKIMSTAEGLSLFESRVANNGFGIIERALAWGDDFHNRQSNRLSALEMNQKDLCESLLHDHCIVLKDEVWNHLRLTSIERLSIDQPKYPGLNTANTRWRK